jgi:putative ABC transport system permease protein
MVGLWMAETRTLSSRIPAAIAFALGALGTRRQRALLALSGIAIGVAAVVALVALGQGLERQMLDEFKKIGTQVMDVQLPGNELLLVKAKEPAEHRARKRVSMDELALVIAAMPEIELMSQQVSISCSDGAERQRIASAVQPEIARILGLTLISGRFLHPLDGNDLWVVLGAKTAQDLSANGARIEPGAPLSICGRSMLIAGVLGHDNVAGSVVNLSIDDCILVSLSAGKRIDPQASDSHLVLRVRPEISPLEFSAKLTDKIFSVTGQKAQINTAGQVLELNREAANANTRFLIALSSISLLVGSLGILNVMLMSVVERRREIGLRLAVGADDIDIGLQFLAESALLGLAGGGIGLVLGVVAAWLIAASAHLPFIVTLSGLALAFGVSLLVGIGAGFYPALKAARLNPVQALST